MSIVQKQLSVSGKQVPCCELHHKGFSIEVLPEQGFSMVSFKYEGRELLDTWDLKTFVGTEADLKHVSENTTDTFRKGFGPSIGPWFGGREEGGKAWQHGLCRFADWTPGLETGEIFVRGRLNGAKARLLNRTLDEICGFHMDVEIEYRLLDEGLEYSIVNHSEGDKGTFGIHWYFISPVGTHVIHKPDMNKLPDFDKAKFERIEEVIVGNPGLALGQRFDNAERVFGALRTRLAYRDGLTIDFRYSNSFKYTMLFSAKQFVCVEPVSGPALEVGTFKEGKIRISPQG